MPGLMLAHAKPLILKIPSGGRYNERIEAFVNVHIMETETLHLVLKRDVRV